LLQDRKIVDESKRKTAIIVAAGSGKRMNQELPKQFVKIGDKPLLAHTVDRFELCPEVEEVVLVVPEDYLAFCQQEIVDRYHFKKVRRIVAGGEQRQDSVWNGLKVLGNNTGLVVVHDGVRPFVPPPKITEGIKLCTDCRAVITAVPVKDTVKEVRQLEVSGTVDRQKLYLVQTPQFFQYEVLMKAYRRAQKEGKYYTDDSALVEALGEPVKVLEGSYDNIKVTTAEDLAFAEFMLSKAAGGGRL
jgi:2-C-methyl-D-erythritol 4-phosphate cytidylyltransferase